MDKQHAPDITTINFFLHASMCIFNAKCAEGEYRIILIFAWEWPERDGINTNDW